MHPFFDIPLEIEDSAKCIWCGELKQESEMTMIFRIRCCQYCKDNPDMRDIFLSEKAYRVIKSCGSSHQYGLALTNYLKLYSKNNDLVSIIQQLRRT